MIIFKSFKRKFLVFLAVCFCVMFATYMRTFFAVPGELTLLEGEEYEYNIESPFFVSIQADKTDVIKLNNDSIKNDGYLYRLSSPLSLLPLKDGTVSLSMKIFGLIPLKTTKVDVVPNKKIVACGKTIGVKLKINGILVIGMSDVETAEGKRILPVKQSGIKIGDLITGVNNVRTNSIDELVEEVERSKGSEIMISYKRADNYNNAFVRPVKAADDDKYHIGLWVRESTAGIGTLTFFDPESKRFGALGHGITDVDTGALMPIDSGEIMESRILEIRKGKEGIPGELRGVFVEENSDLGKISKNSPYGIYGKITEQAVERMSYQQYPIALRNQIKEGRASILANINGDEVKEYKIEIVRVYKQNYDSSKGMVIKVTDKRLLAKTGGIVQGMSGSPIIQNGKIVGAVTHVLVNDPTRGYGIFIEKMIKSMNAGETQALEKAG